MTTAGRGVARDRGNATGLVVAMLLALSGLVAAGLVALVGQIAAHRVQGAADLVALTAAQAKNMGTAEPCTAASRAARADDVSLISCRVEGDDLTFVVTVVVRTVNGSVIGGLPVRPQATAHAGIAGP